MAQLCSKTLHPGCPVALVCVSVDEIAKTDFKKHFIKLMFYLWREEPACAAHRWSSEDNLQVSVLSFHFRAPWDQTQVIRLGIKCLCPLSHLSGPKPQFKKFLRRGGAREIGSAVKRAYSSCGGPEFDSQHKL